MNRDVHNTRFDYSQNVRVALVSTLFRGVGPIMLGHAIPLLWLVVIAARTTESWPPVIFVISSILWIARAIVLFLAKRDQRLRGAQQVLVWETPAKLIGLAWAMTVGIEECLIIFQVHEEALRVIAITLPFGIAATVASRNAGTPHYGVGLLLLLLVPVQLGLAFLGLLYWVVSVMLLGFLGALISVIRRSHVDTVNLLIAEQKNAHLASRLDVALENMKQGLTLFDTVGVLEIANRRFMDLFRLAPHESVTGATALQLLRRCRTALAEPEDAGALPATSLEALAMMKNGAGILRLKNGDIISIQREKLPGGGWLTSYEDITERRRIGDEVEHMAYHDALTGLANRIKFNKRLGDSLALLDRGEWFAVLYLDLDKFKPVNDLYGHAVGDRLLVEAAKRMAASLRKTDLVARLGGDEFAVIISLAPGSEVISELAQHLLENVSRPYQLGEHEVVIGTSIGIALAPNDGADATTLLKAADQSLYNAKAQGRGRFCFSQATAIDPVDASS